MIWISLNSNWRHYTSLPKKSNRLQSVCLIIEENINSPSLSAHHYVIGISSYGTISISNTNDVRSIKLGRVPKQSKG
jgi:hypothetical protein